MKIEKVNDHQIRCTLTKADLADRELKISELAYGTDKAKTLFRDMMQQAAYEFGFEAEIGISTQKLHARGPMGLKELTSYKYLIYGDGQIR